MLKMDESDGPKDSKRTATVDELLDQISQKPSCRYMFMILSLNILYAISPSISYSTVFAGILPTDDDWSCNSTKCDDVVKNFNKSSGGSALCVEYTDAKGDTELVLDSSDINWHPYRTSFAIDFDLYCSAGTRATMRTLISSVYFVGSYCGLIIGGYVFDHIGRKRSALMFALIDTVMTFSGTFCNNYWMLLVIRFFQGIGGIGSGTATYILAVELIPTRYRNYMSGYIQGLWPLGYPLAAGIGYFCHDWHYMYLAASIVFGVMSLPILLAIESPRFYLIKNNEEAAKCSLKKLAAMNGIELDLDDIVLKDDNKASERQQGFLQQLSEFFRYPVLYLETLMQMLMWFVTAMSYYGFNFGWSSILPNLYLGYLLAAVGEQIGYVGIIPLVQQFGRRRAMMWTFLGISVTYLIAIPDVPLGGDWRLDSIAGLVGICLISAVFSGIYLLTGELAPTSHRGLVFCLSSSAARVGSFIGPFIFNNLTDIAPRWVPQVVLAGLFVLCGLCAFLLVETGGRDVPAVPEDVKERRKEWRWKL